MFEKIYFFINFLSLARFARDHKKILLKNMSSSLITEKIYSSKRKQLSTKPVVLILTHKKI